MGLGEMKWKLEMKMKNGNGKMKSIQSSFHLRKVKIELGMGYDL